MRKVYVVVTDTHNGHPLSLPANQDGWDYIDGGWQENSGWQELIGRHWDDCWRQVADLRKGAQLIVHHYGDPIEGKHHDNIQLLTQRVDEQERQHINSMQWGLGLAKWHRKRDKLAYFTGTPAHCGNGNSSTERIVRALLDTDDLDGTQLRAHMYGTINGVLFDGAHKGFRTGNREWTRTNGIRAWLTSQWFSRLKAGEYMPRFFIRAHYHTFAHASIEDDYGHPVSDAYLAPAWKLRDDYVEQFAPEAVSNIGLLAFVVEDNGQCKPVPMLMTVKQDEIEEL